LFPATFPTLLVYLSELSHLFCIATDDVRCVAVKMFGSKSITG